MFGREIRWFASDDLPEIARTNILNSHRVELRAFVDWLRVSRAEAMAYPHAGDIGTAVLYEPTALAMRMKRETLRLMRVAERVSGLPQEMASRDLLHAESAAAPLGRVQSWRRSFLRARGLRRKAKLVATAFRPTVTDYENSTTVSNARTNAALRKSSLGSRK